MVLSAMKRNKVNPVSEPSMDDEGVQEGIHGCRPMERKEFEGALFCQLSIDHFNLYFSSNHSATKGILKTDKKYDNKQ